MRESENTRATVGTLDSDPSPQAWAFSVTVTESLTPIPFQSADLHTMRTYGQYRGVLPNKTIWKNAEFGSVVY